MSGPLASAFRAKYPGSYDAVPDEELEQAIIAKYPGSYDHLVEKKPATPAASSAPVEHPHARIGRNVIDAAKGVKAGALSTVYHGGDLVRRGWNAVAPDALDVERVIDRPDVQASMTPPDSFGGKAGFFLEQAAEFAVPLTRLAKLTKGMGLGKRMAVDAASSAGVAGLQTGGDANAVMLGGALGGAVPVVGKGLRLVGGTVRNAAAGAKEGGLGGAVASAVRSTVPLDSNFMLFQGLKPRNSRTQFGKTLEAAVPEIKASEAALGRPIAGVDDLLAATKDAKKRIRTQYDAIAGPKRAIGATVDLTSMADEMVARIPKKLRLENPEAADAIEAVAAKYRRAFPLEDAEQLLKETNGELDAFYNKFPMGQRKALVSDPEAARLDAQAKGLRDAIYRTLDAPGQPDGARALNRVYGQLMEVEDTALRRANVAKRQQPESLSEQIANAGAAADRAAGVYRMGRGALTGSVSEVIGGGADMVRGQVRRETAKFLKEQQTTDALIRRAFAGVKTKPGVYAQPVTRPVKGLLGPGARPMPASVAPDTSGPIPPTLPENINRPRVETDADGVVPDFGLDDVAPKTVAPDQAERSFMLRWLADDLDEMPFQQGGSNAKGRRAAYETLDPEEAHALTYNAHVAGTPTQEMFHAMGITGSRSRIAKQLKAAISGEKSSPKMEALADAMREAWDGQRFDWQLVNDETVAKLGIRRRDFRSPVTTPNEDDMPGVFTKLFGGGE